MRKMFCILALAVLALATPGFAVPYSHVQATADVSTSPVSRFVTVRIHLRNLGDIATACVVKASGQKRSTGLSIGGEADVTFDALSSYKGYTVVCSAN
jgi:hypothetical protein